jgi:hypothetical protein
MASVALQLKVVAIGGLVKWLTGENPIVEYGDDFVNISFSEPQKVILQKWVESQLDTSLTAKPGDIRIDFNSILVPVAVKKIAPVAIGSGAIGFILGKLL